MLVLGNSLFNWKYQEKVQTQWKTEVKYLIIPKFICTNFIRLWTGNKASIWYLSSNDSTKMCCFIFSLFLLITFVVSQKMLNTSSHRLNDVYHYIKIIFAYCIPKLRERESVCMCVRAEHFLFGMNASCHNVSLLSRCRFL